MYANCLKGPFDNSTNVRVGSILPHGQNIREWAKSTAKRYEDVKNAYESMCGAGSWETNPHLTAMLQEFSRSVPPEFENVLETKKQEDAEHQHQLWD